MDDPIEELFRNRLQHHEESPPAHAWPRIREEIAPSRGPRPAFGWPLFSVLLLLGLAAVMLMVRQIPGQSADSQALTEATPPAPLPSSQARAAAATAPPAATNGPVHSASVAGAQPAGPASRQPVAPHGSAGATLNAPEAQPLPGSRQAWPTGRAAAPRGIGIPAAPAAVAALPGTQPEKAKDLADKTSRQKLAAAHGAGITLRGAASQGMARHATRNPRQPAGTTAPEPQPISREAGAASRQAHTDSPAAKPEAEELAAAAAAAGTADAYANTASLPPTAPAGASASDSAVTAAPEQTASDALRLAAPSDSAAPDSETASRLNYGFYTGARYRLRRFAPNPSDQLYITNLTDKNAGHPTRFDYELGAAVQWQLTDKLAAEATLGALYVAEQVAYKATSGQQTSPTITQAGNQLHLQPNYLYNSHSIQTRAVYSNMRTGLVYTVGKAPAGRLQLSGGGQMSLLTWHSSRAFVNDTPAPTAGPGLSRLQTGAYAGVRLKRSLSKGLDLAIEPSAGYYFNSRYRQAAPFRISNHTYNLNLLFFLK